MKSPASVFEFVGAIIKNCSSQLPRTCPACSRVFSNFKQFIRDTTPIGVPQALSQSDKDPIGILTYVNCKCGATMVLKCEDATGAMHQMFRDTIDAQCKRESKTPGALLSDLRARVRQQALSMPD